MTKSKKKDIYKLHIDAMPHVAHSVPASPAGKQKPMHKIQHQEASRAPKNKFRAFVWDKVQFLLVSAGVFIGLYLIMNWQALWLNATYYWDKWRGFESPLAQLVEQKIAEPEKLLSAKVAKGAVAEIPALNLEIYPPDMRIVIPRINQNVPVVGVKNENLIARKWNELESDIQKSLKNGVIHYPGTALPGDNGNVVITGHSSYYAWDAGRFKDVFALLHDVQIKDRIVVYFNQKKYVYEVTKIKVVAPKDVDILSPTSNEQLTLITCTPIGTNLKRLIVIAKLVEKG